jgi:hypothetical protein
LLDATTEKVDVSLGREFDDVRFYGAAGSGTVKFGRGGGTLKLYDFDEVRLDLADHELKLDEAFRYDVSGFTRVYATGRRVILEGDARVNGFRSFACRTTLRGGGGDDTLQASADTGIEDCTPKGANIFGGKGDDRMTGSARGDFLSGGAGRDKANGGKGNDKCVAEKRTACER